MCEVKALIRPDRLDEVLHALHAIEGVPGVTISLVRGVGHAASGDRVATGFADVEMAKLEVVLDDQLEDVVVAAIAAAGHTGRHGDGKVFVSPVSRMVHVRTGEDVR